MFPRPHLSLFGVMFASLLSTLALKSHVIIFMWVFSDFAFERSRYNCFISSFVGWLTGGGVYLNDLDTVPF